MNGGRNQAAERLLTVAEAADVLRTSERFPRRLIAERRIRFVRVGRHVRIPQSSTPGVHRGRARRTPQYQEKKGSVMGKRRFGRVRKLPSGRYQARYPDPTGTATPPTSPDPTITNPDEYPDSASSRLRHSTWLEHCSLPVPTREPVCGS